MTIIQHASMSSIPGISSSVPYHKLEESSSLEESLQVWEKEDNANDKFRQVAVKKILACIRNQEERLDLSGLGLSSLPPDIFSHLQHLKELDLSNNRFQAFPYGIEELQNLQILDISENLLDELPEIEGPNPFKGLIELNISGNRLKTLPSWIEELESLNVFIASDNNLEDLPPGIGNLKLRTLNIAQNRFNCLPGCIKKLITLIAFNVSDNTNLGDSDPLQVICYLRKLEELNLSLIGLRKLGPEIGIFRELKTLNLSYNYLEDLPKAMGDLPKLQELDLSDNDNLINRLRSVFGPGFSLTRQLNLPHRCKILPDDLS